MIMRPMGASLGMLSLALAVKWAFTLGATLGSAGILGLCALRRAMKDRKAGGVAPDPIHDAVT